jgi:hypothetical protein
MIFDKKSNPSLLLTKQEFYTYTIQIAIFRSIGGIVSDQKKLLLQTKEMV